MRINNCYIVILTASRPRLFFQFMPDAISDSKTAIWNDIPIIGRSEPWRFYSSSSPRSISFTFDIFGTGDESKNLEQEVKSKVEFLRSLSYPVYAQSGVALTPPLVLLVIGDLLNSSFTGRKGMRGIVTRNNVVYRPPWSVINSFTFKLPYFASVDLTIDEVNDPLVPGFHDIFPANFFPGDAPITIEPPPIEPTPIGAPPPGI